MRILVRACSIRDSIYPCDYCYLYRHSLPAYNARQAIYFAYERKKELSVIPTSPARNQRLQYKRQRPTNSNSNHAFQHARLCPSIKPHSIVRQRRKQSNKNNFFPLCSISEVNRILILVSICVQIDCD